MVIFSPWAFGGWPKWSIWTMNIGGYALGLLYLAKLIIRHRTGFRPLRWGGRQPKFIRYGLGAITILLLGWCLISAVNARASVDLDNLVLLEKARWIDWLPHSYDQPSTWFAFWQYLGLAGVFWALRDWVSVATRQEYSLLRHSAGLENSPFPTNSPSDHEPLADRAWLAHRLPDRLNRLLWVLCVNGALVALVGILSTFANPSKVLWLLPHETRSANFFGPFYYRNHGAALANLLWPVCLGLWLAHGLRSEKAGHGFLASLGRSGASLLPLCVSVMVAAPFISSSRGGSVVAVLLLAACVPLLLLMLRSSRIVLTTAGAIMVIGGGAGLWLAWEPLQQRFLHGFFAHPTGVERPLTEYTIRAKIRIPSRWDPWYSTFAGLSDSPTILWGSSGTMTLSLRKGGVFEARFVGSSRNQVLTLAATNALFADVGRTVEVIFTQRAGESAVYLNGEPLNLSKSVTQGNFDWPARPASAYLWIGQGGGGSLKFNDRIEAVTLLDHALTPSAVTTLADRDPKPASDFWRRAGASLRAWEELGPVLNVSPGVLSPRVWFETGLGGRSEIGEASRKMMAGYPAALGSGPLTYASLFKVFRGMSDSGHDWFAHNDWLEARITYGFLGAGIIYVGLALCPAAMGTLGGVPVPWCLGAGLLLALAGGLLHARFDWILQIHSLLFAAVCLVGLLSSISLRTSRRSVCP